MSAEAITDTAPSPWWPCPSCGGMWFTATLCFERGHWVDYVTEDGYEIYDPPLGIPSSVRCDEVTCDGCGWSGNLIAEYGWGEHPEESR
jgi:hypothetical protein